MSFRRLTQVLGTTGASSVPKKEEEFIIVLIGDLYVGKTSAFVADPFSATVIPTTGELYICTMRDKHPNYQYTRLVMKTSCRSICLFYSLWGDVAICYVAPLRHYVCPSRTGLTGSVPEVVVIVCTAPINYVER